jgi:hypothetical protein
MPVSPTAVPFHQGAAFPLHKCKVPIENRRCKVHCHKPKHNVPNYKNQQDNDGELGHTVMKRNQGIVCSGAKRKKHPSHPDGIQSQARIGSNQIVQDTWIDAEEQYNVVEQLTGDGGSDGDRPRLMIQADVWTHWDALLLRIIHLTGARQHEQYGGTTVHKNIAEV